VFVYTPKGKRKTQVSFEMKEKNKNQQALGRKKERDRLVVKGGAKSGGINCRPSSVRTIVMMTTWLEDGNVSLFPFRLLFVPLPRHNDTMDCASIDRIGL
jgi:hypothetical protein